MHVVKMDANYTRRPEELIVRYNLEPTLKELFVEGETDKAFVLNYVKKRNLKYSVHTIESVNTKSLISDGEVNIGKKQLLEKLSAYFESKLGSRKICVFCICDRDDDMFITIPLTNTYILKTDFSSLESYAFNEEVLGKFLNILLHRKAPEGNKAVADIVPAVQFLFSVRLTRYTINRSWNSVDIAKAVTFDKSGRGTFEINDYIKKMSGHANNRDVNSKKDLIISYYESFISSYVGIDYRFIMQGHDFAKVVNLYQRQLGGQNIADDIFEKTLLMAIEAEDLDSHPMFQTIAGCII